jgi:cyclophilin family peptidyl-prolyl cis-trans isomerase
MKLISRSFALLAGVLLVGGCAGKQPEAPVTYTGPDPLVTIDAFIADRHIDTDDPTWRTHVPRPPAVAFDPTKKYYWVLQTNVGTVKIELLPAYAPRHVASTIYLTRLGFYDGLTFHRIIPKFMAQGGDPLGTGGGGPGFRYSGEFHKKAKHDERGVVSMANSGPRTDGSQFFILFGEAPHLDGKHTVFGQVVEGLGTLRSMEAVGTEDGKPRRNIVIEKAEILTS